MKILHISDTHGFHEQLIIDRQPDILIHSGDESNFRDYRNEAEFFSFFEWFKKLDIQHKIFIAGNHSAFIYKHEKEVRKLAYDNNIIYLNKDEVIINGVKFYGEPTTPTFGNWFFMSHRAKMFNHWSVVPFDINILITHGPPYGILDSTINIDNFTEIVGDKSLRKMIENNNWPYLQAVCFGHVHKTGLINPPGVLHYKEILFSNGACVEDGRFDKGLIFHGNYLTI